MGIEQHGFAVTVFAAHHQVGNGLKPGGVHLGLGHDVLLHDKTKTLQQVGSTVGVRRVVARWRVSGNVDEFLQKAHLLVKVGVDPGVKLLVGVHERWFAAGLESWSSRCRKASTASCISSLVLDSSGLWLMPELRPRTNSMACGMISCSFMAS